MIVLLYIFRINAVWGTSEPHGKIAALEESETISFSSPRCDFSSVPCCCCLFVLENNTDIILIVQVSLYLESAA